MSKNFSFRYLNYRYWSRNCLSHEEIQHEMKRDDGSATIVDWCSFFRCVAEDYLVKNPIKFSGPGEIVEIDETIFATFRFNTQAFPGSGKRFSLRKCKIQIPLCFYH